MTRQRRLLFLSLVFTPAVLIAASCSFPDVAFAPSGSEAGASADGNTSLDASDATLGDASLVGANEDVDEAGDKQEAATVPDGAQRIDAGPDAACCDCDLDGRRSATSPGTCAAPTGDCDDSNPYVVPGQSPINSPTWDSPHLPQFDWDCDGVVFKQYKHDLGACSSHNKPVGGNCSAFQGGYVGDPDCGAPDRYIITCNNNPNILLAQCVEGEADRRAQGCR